MIEYINNAKQAIKRALLKRCYFFNGNIYNIFSGEQEEPDSTLALIISRRYFFETQKTYKITEQKDLIKAIQLEVDSLSPFSSTLAFYGIEKGHESCSVTFWLMDKQKLPANIDIYCIFPEPALAFTAKIDSGHCQFSASESAMYWTSKDGFFSHWREERVTAAHYSDVLEKVDYFSLILQAIQGSFKNRINGVFAFTQDLVLKKLTNINWLRLKPFALLFLGFVVVETVYLSAMKFGVEKYRTEVSQSLGEFLDKEREYNLMAEKITALESLHQDNHVISKQLNILRANIPDNAELVINSIRSENGILRFRGEANSATSILSSLNADDKLKEAKFVESVNIANDSSREVFHIEVRFN